MILGHEGRVEADSRQKIQGSWAGAGRQGWWLRKEGDDVGLGCLECVGEEEPEDG